ncbi:M91 family zinc metallopeptidase [Falsiroseomonas oryzae]|uniref:M91 family zinc metallopeptidase n=1 Tax=Falsiroseomonas oryzae TaxID=2766473 RepID=UPI0022EB2799|nr:M91 family zinc metallopeptidase [Roseomonas sp. MO-31]
MALKLVPGYRIFAYDDAFVGDAVFWLSNLIDCLKQIEQLPTGFELLKSIRMAKPGYRKPGLPLGVLIVFLRQVDGANVLPPGLSNRFGNLVEINEVAYQTFKTGNGSGAMNLTSPNMMADNQQSAMGVAGFPLGSTANMDWSSSAGSFIGANGYLPPFITLAHELIHGLHMLTGTMKQDNAEEESETVGCQVASSFGPTYGVAYNPLHLATLPAFCENRIRHEAGIPRRLAY